VAEQLLPREHLARVAQERLDEGELAGREVHGAAVDVGAAGTQVQLQVPVREHRELRRPVRGQPQPDARAAQRPGENADDKQRDRRDDQREAHGPDPRSAGGPRMKAG
jgi:hypothetical protein